MEENRFIERYLRAIERLNYPQEVDIDALREVLFGGIYNESILETSTDQKEQNTIKIFKINDLVDLRLRDNKTYIYINDKQFRICSYLLINIPKDRFQGYNNANSIDEASEVLDKSLELKPANRYNITPEEEFWAHCSNIQVFFENGLNTDLLHTNISFPLLKELVNHGFEPALKVFKEEIKKRFNQGTTQSREFLRRGGYLKYLKEEGKTIKVYNEPIHRTESIYKVILIGDPAVGIDTLLRNVSSGQFEEKYLPTVGVNIFKVQIHIKKYDHTVNLMLWDIAGQPQFYMLHRPYFTGADGMILVFDITRSSTFSNVNNWYSSAVKYGLSGIPRILIGNKVELSGDRKIILPMAEHLSEKLNAPYFETASYDGEKFGLILQKMAELIYEKDPASKRYRKEQERTLKPTQEVFKEEKRKRFKEGAPQLKKFLKDKVYPNFLIKEEKQVLKGSKDIIFKINDMVDLRLINNKTHIYVNNKRLIICSFLLLNTQKDVFRVGNHFQTIDEEIEVKDKSLEWAPAYHYNISPKEEFWAHCSNIQAFFENGLNTDLLHSNIAFPLLKELVNQGFEPASKVFNEEILKRFNEGTTNSRKFLIEQGYLKFLSRGEKKSLKEFNESYDSVSPSTPPNMLLRGLYRDFTRSSTSVKMDSEIFKIIVMGDPAVGKRTLLNNFTTDQFKKDVFLNIGLTVAKTSVNVKKYNRRVELMFWNIAGDRQFYTEYRPYFASVDGILLVFDVTRSSTFNNLNKWYNLAVKYKLSEIPRILIGNKIDLKDDRKIILPIVEYLSQKLHAPYFETSNINNKNIELILQKMAELVIESKNSPIAPKFKSSKKKDDEDEDDEGELPSWYPPPGPSGATAAAEKGW